MKKKVILGVIIGIISMGFIKPIQTEATLIGTESQAYSWDSHGYLYSTENTSSGEYDYIATNNSTANCVEMVRVNKNYYGKTQLRFYRKGPSGNYYTSKTVNTILGNTMEWEFDMFDYNNDGYQDLVGICRAGASNRTEIHILSGADNYKTFLLQIATALHTTKDKTIHEFDFGDYNNDGIQDLYFFAKNNTGSKKTEVHVLDGASNFQQFTVHSATRLEYTDDNWIFKTMKSNYDDTITQVFAINTKGNNGVCEIFELNGGNSYTKKINKFDSPLDNVGKDFEIETTNKEEKNSRENYVNRFYVINKNALNGTEIYSFAENYEFLSIVHNNGTYARDLANKEYSEAKYRTNNDGVGDAFRHAYWCIKNYYDVGALNALDAAGIYEDTHPNSNPLSTEMDEYNNKVAVQIAQNLFADKRNLTSSTFSDENIKEIVKQAIAEGKFKVMDKTGNRLVWSNDPAALEY